MRDLFKEEKYENEIMKEGRRNEKTEPKGGLNSRPLDSKSHALPLELPPLT